MTRVLAVTVLCLLPFVAAGCDSDRPASRPTNGDILWTNTINKRDPQSIRRYLNEFPDGTYANDARALLVPFEFRDMLGNALKAGTVDALDAFLSATEPHRGNVEILEARQSARVALLELRPDLAAGMALLAEFKVSTDRSAPPDPFGERNRIARAAYEVCSRLIRAESGDCEIWQFQNAGTAHHSLAWAIQNAASRLETSTGWAMCIAAEPDSPSAAEWRLRQAQCERVRAALATDTREAWQALDRDPELVDAYRRMAVVGFVSRVLAGKELPAGEPSEHMGARVDDRYEATIDEDTIRVPAGASMIVVFQPEPEHTNPPWQYDCQLADHGRVLGARLAVPATTADVVLVRTARRDKVGSYPAQTFGELRVVPDAMRTVATWHAVSAATGESYGRMVITAWPPAVATVSREPSISGSTYGKEVEWLTKLISR